MFTFFDRFFESLFNHLNVIMSAEIHPAPSTSDTLKKLELSAKLEGHRDVVNKALVLKDEEGVISISDDK